MLSSRECLLKEEGKKVGWSGLVLSRVVSGGKGAAEGVDQVNERMLSVERVKFAQEIKTKQDQISKKVAE